jgi:hypothetical protein
VTGNRPDESPAGRAVRGPAPGGRAFHGRPLAGKVVLITGAARGIGAHTARLAAAAGARLALLGLEPERLAALTAELNAATRSTATGDTATGNDTTDDGTTGNSTTDDGANGDGVHVWAECDVTDQPSLERAIGRVVGALGRIDIVLANAGIASYGTVEVTPAGALARTVEVNLIGAMRTVSATLPYLTATRGYYLLVSSVAAFSTLPGMAAYSASKAGVEQFANTLRLELEHRGVAVGVAHPSWTDTDLVRDARRDLPSFGAALHRLPWPVGSVVPVRRCARALVDGMARRRRRVYVPRAVGLMQSLRTVVLSPLGDAVLRGAARRSVPALEAEARTLGRSFGEHSTGAAGGPDGAGTGGPAAGGER